MSHLLNFSEKLASNLQSNPTIVQPLMEKVAKKIARRVCNIPEDILIDPLLNFQVQFSSDALPMAVRDLQSDCIGKLVRIPGIVVSASTVVAKPTNVYVLCKTCGDHKYLTVNSAFGGVSIPRTCSGANSQQMACSIDPYVIVSDKCQCVDQQTLKLQEPPDLVPVGELPRHVILTVDRNLVNTVSPGSRVIVNGIFSIFQSKSGKNNKAAIAIRSPYIKVLGIEKDPEGSGRSLLNTFTEEQEQEMISFSKTPDLYSKFSKNIAPSIFGHEDIKKALACLLFGGSRKLLPDKMKLRGDINVLMLGDPGVAKSQFLKFVEKVAPISVYTSGKGSSAAGLTASVVRDSGSGDFYLEGGAMVLADGGVVCIDEFDKMDNDDRVAIHEAMEQQTISIAKAGITTILNSRTSVLAAANPVFGRYDEMKSPGENIDFSTTILSRFDMIFIVRDEHNVDKDITLAKHVLSVHMNQSVEQQIGDIDLQMMKRYISYCKSKCAPRLSADAAEKLINHYVTMRSDVHKMEQTSSERSSIPITVRQLEAIIRISESLAKISLSAVATEDHVDEALRLFRVSTMQAVLSGHSLEGMTRPDLLKEVDRIEKMIRQRVAIGSTVSFRTLVKEMTESKGFHEHAVLRCIDIMVQQEKFVFRNQRRVLIRQI